MVVIVDYKVGNLGALLNMVQRVGATARISDQIQDLKSADKIILPGIGRFDYAMRKLHESGLVPTLTEKVLEQKTPTLGICVGAQMMAETSEEDDSGQALGLGWFPAVVKKFKFSEAEKLSIPHMGWETLQIQSRGGLLKNLDAEEHRFYFAHSYYIQCRDRQQVAATVDYGHSVDVVLEHKNISAVQFHPEKSHRYGMEIFRQFAGTP